MSTHGHVKVLTTLQMGRGLAALAVVLFHAEVVFAWSKFWGFEPFGGFFKAGNCGVYFFFALSGFVITLAHHDDISKPWRFGRYAWNRLSRIYPIYWIVTAFAALASWVIHSNPAPDAHEPYYSIGTITLIPFDGDHAVLAVAWTLFYEIIFYAIFSVIVLNRRAGIIALAIWGALCLRSLWHPFENHALLTIFGSINLIFLMGMAAALGWRAISRSLAPITLTLGTAMIAWLWIGHPMLNDTPDAFPVFRIYLLYGFASALVLASLVACEDKRGWKMPRPLTVLGDASYSIYLTHFLVVSAAARILIRIPFLPYPAGFLLLVALGLAAGTACYFVLERPLLKRLRRAFPLERD